MFSFCSDICYEKKSTEEIPRIPSPTIITSPHIIALQFGLEYTNTIYSLKGTANDCRNVHNYLNALSCENYLFLDSDQRITKKFFIDKIRFYRDQLKQSTVSNKVLFIHYAGHGIQLNDYNNDEEDGKDEAFCFHDENNFGNLDFYRDDEFHDLLMEDPIPNLTIFVVPDCCHSGTLIDLHTYDPMTKTIILNNQKSAKLPKIIEISGCRDNQTAKEYAGNGYLTSSLLEALRFTTEYSGTPVLVIDLHKLMSFSLQKKIKKTDQCTELSTNLSVAELQNTYWLNITG